MRQVSILTKIIPILVIAAGAGMAIGSAFAQSDPAIQSSLYIPLIGITAVPDPLALPEGPGDVTYGYAVKNFIAGLPLTDVQVTDNNCNPVTFVAGDDNNNAKLDFDETWRYVCTKKISVTTQSIATATGITNGVTASHKAYAAVVVGSGVQPPLVSIVNVTKVANPLFLPAEGGAITFTYRVNNPGVVPLSGVIVSDDKCGQMSGKLGDTNGNNLLDTNEVWVYTCAMILKETTTNTVTVTAFANEFRATGSYTLTVTVVSPALPNTGLNFLSGENMKKIVWVILLGILMVLFAVFIFTRKYKQNKK